jgi:hypothetical protein
VALWELGISGVSSVPFWGFSEKEILIGVVIYFRSQSCQVSLPSQFQLHRPLILILPGTTLPERC